MSKYTINILFPLFFVLAVVGFTSCIEDGFTTSPTDQPAFSCDTLKLGEAYTLDGTPTRKFTVYNRHDKMLSIGSISLRDDAEGSFRLNVDGISGRTFSNVEIRPNDSIFVFVEATLPENGSSDAVDLYRHLDFVTNGVTSTVVFEIKGQDAVRCRNLVIDRDTEWEAGRPYLIYDTLRVAEGATLTLQPGTRLRFHDSAAMKVEGTLVAKGTADEPVEMVGDRVGNVASTIPYELMSGQWGGVYFASTSRENYMSHTSIRNSCDGVVLSPIESGTAPALTMVNCQVRNTTDYVINAEHANLRLVGCELTDASNGILRLVGGRHEINHCTIANYYLFTILGGPAVQLGHLSADDPAVDADGNPSPKPYLSADFSNCIIYGNGIDLSHGDFTGMDIYMRRCILSSEGSDDDNFIGCLWATDPLYYTVRNEYHFDYRLRPESPAIGAAVAEYDRYCLEADRYGVKLSNPSDLGAYVYVAPEE